MLAYIDPGAGAILLQSIIAAALGVLIFFRDSVKRVFRIVFPARKKPDAPTKPDDAKQPSPEP
jgi:hypothetical protein